MKEDLPKKEQDQQFYFPSDAHKKKFIKTLNHLDKLAKRLSCVVSTYL